MESDDIKGPYGNFDNFLKYATSPIRAFAKSVKKDCLSNKTVDGKTVIYFDWTKFRPKLLQEIYYLSGRSAGGVDVVFTPEIDVMEFWYKKVAQAKARNPNITTYELEQEVRKALPPDLRMFVAPATTEDNLRHNLKIGYENYIASALGTPQSVMVVNKLVDNLENRIKNMAIQGKRSVGRAGSKLICTATEEKQEEKIYPDLNELKATENTSAAPSAPPDYQEVMLVQRDTRGQFGNRFSGGNYRQYDRYPSNRFAYDRFQPNRFQNNRFQQGRRFGGSNFSPRGGRTFTSNRFENQNRSNFAKPRSNDNRGTNRREEVTCYACGVKGHFANECDTRKSNTKNYRGNN